LGSEKKKIKIEIEDDDGGRYNLSLEGNISKSKLMKAIDFMELVNGNADKARNNNEEDNHNNPDNYRRVESTNQFERSYNEPQISSAGRITSSSLTSKIWDLIETKLHKTSFTSSDVVLLYKREYNELIRLDKVATYLARYYEKGKLERSKRTKEWIYKLATSKSQAASSNNIMTNHQDSMLHKFYPPSKQIHASEFN
jgi:predicted transcriptional regulator